MKKHSYLAQPSTTFQAKKNDQINHAKSGAGQTYIEVIVATGLLSMALLAIVGLATAQLKLGGQSAKKLIAYNLASEGVEVCEAIRMDQWLDPDSSWPYGLADGNWVLDYSSTSTTAADNADLSLCNNCSLCQQADDSFKICSDSNSIFKRMVTISTVSAYEKKIISEVRYLENTWKSIKMEKNLTDWK
ncbi:hypothetical protein COW09_00135 [bacterium (Candidatus Moisslbacteria) CG12_big_fil_rev_8_21_14_0_65_36_11]|nr:MAG: hypothetical protein COW09_00135 [bacterium (Candidatus Moisslbacteria) CG12_big_fil_rev_8_21_14_0_65_36_11]